MRQWEIHYPTEFTVFCNEVKKNGLLGKNFFIEEVGARETMVKFQVYDPFGDGRFYIYCDSDALMDFDFNSHASNSLAMERAEKFIINFIMAVPNKSVGVDTFEEAIYDEFPFNPKRRTNNEIR